MLSCYDKNITSGNVRVLLTTTRYSNFHDKGVNEHKEVCENEWVPGTIVTKLVHVPRVATTY